MPLSGKAKSILLQFYEEPRSIAANFCMVDSSCQTIAVNSFAFALQASKSASSVTGDTPLSLSTGAVRTLLQSHEDAAAAATEHADALAAQTAAAEQEQTSYSASDATRSAASAVRPMSNAPKKKLKITLKKKS